MKKITSCLLSGVGGQGTVLASKLIAQSAMMRGFDVRTSETIGMAQRGGCVVSHVRFGEDIASPMIPKSGADVLIAFEPAEAVRNAAYLAPDGVAVVNIKPIMPITVNFGGAPYNADEMLAWLKANVKNLILVDGDAICEKCGSAKVLNIALLAAAVKSGALSMTVDELREVVTRRVNPKFHAMNLAAIDETIKLYGEN